MIVFCLCFCLRDGGAKGVEESCGGSGMESTRCESEGAMGEHGSGKAEGDGGRLGMEVAKHRVAAPSTDELDDTRVDFAAEESHGAACTETTGRDIRGEKPRVWLLPGCKTEHVGDVLAGNTLPEGAEEVGAQRSGRRGVVLAEIEAAAGKSFSGTREGITAGGVRDDFAALSILLGAKGDRRFGNVTEEVDGARCWIEGGVTHFEADGGHGEGGVVASVAILAWPKEIVVSDPGHVHDRGAGCGGIQPGLPLSAMEKLDGN